MTSPPATAAAPSSAVVMEPAGNVTTAVTDLARSWADQVVDLAKDAGGMKPRIRVRGNSSNTTIKAVPRQLTCFVGRLAPDVGGGADAVPDMSWDCRRQVQEDNDT